MTREACENFVGPMPIALFLSEFIPRASTERPANEIPFPHSSVSQNEDAFISAVEQSHLCPNLKFINTTFRHDGRRRLKPDISIYSDYSSDNTRTQRFLDWRAVDLWIENKTSNDDIFCDLTVMRRQEAEDDDLESHIRWTNSAYRIYGQLLRCDRSGVIYTEPFDWANDPDTLFEFFWRLNFLSDVDRGYDTTVTSVKDDEAEVALSKLRTYKGLENIKTTDLHKILVHDDHVFDGQLRYYITPSAVWYTEALFGRSTFGYIAYDVATSRLVYLKDFWRTTLPRIQREGDVYRELHEAQVPNIPLLGRAGDVPLSPEHANIFPLAVQRTKTQDYVKGSGVGHEWCPGRPRVDSYVHYRLVLETLGQSLNTFKSTRQLCEVIRDAIVAHTVAYEKAHILHRDVSAANILITEGGSGILIDWDLSKKVTRDDDSKPRQHSRTGTWQFISIARLRDPSIRPHEPSDDLESFFWVLLYEIVKCRSAQTKHLFEGMQKVFDQDTGLGRDGIVRGGDGKLICLAGILFGPTALDFLVSTPCKGILEQLRSLFRDFYLHVPSTTDIDMDPKQEETIEVKRENDPRVQESREKLRSSEWDVDDDGSLSTAQFRLDPSGSKNRRKRKALDDVDEKGTYNGKRKWRLPPKMTVPPVDSLSSQGHRDFLGGTLSTPSSVALQASDGLSAQASGSSELRSGVLE
ncbi:hypothetical protein BC827DRAFT_1244831 [Russula dissimulans]|nr:hypothetical protein BC827DRAFT_1244831 [Russula dissimulans]